MALSRRARWLQAGAMGFLVLIPVLVLAALGGLVAYWGFGLAEIDGGPLGARFIVLADHPPEPDRRLFGFLACLPPLVFQLLGAWSLWRLFAGFRFGSLVGAAAIRHLRSFAGYTALAVLTGFALSGVMRWAAGAFDDAPLWTHLGFSTTHAAILFMAGLVYMASFIVEEGEEYRRETEDYV